MENRPLSIHGDGLQTRDFTYIEDVVNCNLLAASVSTEKGAIYNVGAGSQTSIEALADEIIHATKSESTKKYNSPLPGDVRDSLAGLEKVKKDLGYSPKVNIREGVSKTLEWVKTQPTLHS